ncbi:MAG: DedA family protein [Bacteroidota bacterium]|nr:DedA family protein [Bacteroidota bacterium]
MESLFHSFQNLHPFWIYLALFSFAYIENIFPPTPSDIVIVFAGSLIPFGQIHFVPALVIATLGSTAGFMTMYIVGDWIGISIVEKRKLRFLPLENVHKVEEWFRRWGYALIIANRFLSGTRAVVSFFAGMSELKLLPTSVLCFFSALLWNFLLIYLGSVLGQNWHAISAYLVTYSKFVTAVILVVIIFFVVRWLYKKRTKASGNFQ